MALTLAVADNADGTGGVATLAGTLGASATVYSAAFGGTFGALAWAAAGTRAGDGTVAVAPGKGYYLWYAAAGSLVAAPVYQALTDGTQAVHYRCLTATQAQLVALALSGITAANVQVLWLQEYWQYRGTFPGIAVVPAGREGQPGVMTGKDDVAYPVAVSILDNGVDRPVLDQPTRLLWRQKIFRAFRHQRLPGVPEVLTCDVDPDYVIRPDAGQAVRPFDSSVLLKFRSREARGFGA